MPAHNFDEDQNVQEVITTIINGYEPQEMIAALDSASKMDRESRAYIASKIEEKAILSTTETFNDADSITQMREMVSAARTETLGDVDKSAMLFTRIILFIAENKDAEPLPFVKVYVDEMSKLSDEEYSFPINHMEVVCRAAEKMQGLPCGSSEPLLKASIQPNPFSRFKEPTVPPAPPEPEIDLTATFERLKKNKPSVPVLRTSKPPGIQ